jgi:hypothetical protein
MCKQNEAYPYNEKEKNIDMYYNLDEPQSHCTR